MAKQCKVCVREVTCTSGTKNVNYIISQRRLLDIYFILSNMLNTNSTLNANMQSELHAIVHMRLVEYATHCRPNTIFVYVRHNVQHWISVYMVKVF